MMMDEKSTPVALLCAMLAEMTERAVEAERERDEALRSKDEWIRICSVKDDGLREVHQKLAEEIELHEKTRASLNEMDKALNEEMDAHKNTRTRLKDYIAKLEQENEAYKRDSEQLSEFKAKKRAEMQKYAAPAPVIAKEGTDNHAE